MRYRKKSNRSHCTAFLFLLSVSTIVLIALIKTEKCIKPVAELQAEHFAQKTAAQVIETTVSDYLEANRFTYSDFAAVLYDESGRAVSIETVTYNINKVQSELSMRINSEFAGSAGAPAEIPLGSLTNSYLLAGKGPHIRLRICPAREADVRLTSSFTSAGVNQTCHRISAVVTADIKSSIPLYTFSAEAAFEFVLAENIIVGDVPETVLNLEK